MQQFLLKPKKVMAQNKKHTFTFIDLFAGIGGTRLGFEKAGGKCVFTSEWDKFAQQTYQANFGELAHGDIAEVRSSDIPNFDVLIGGFPCQPFSLAGVSKKQSMGRKHGFEEEKQGNLFFEIERIIKDKKPKAFMLENVKNIVSHDKGNTFKVIRETIDKLGYTFDYKIVDAKLLAPQHRERTYMIGYRKDLVGDDFSFDFPTIRDKKPKLSDILEDKVSEKYTLSDKLWDYLQRYAKKHKEKGNGFGYGLPDLDGTTRTLSARYHKDGSEILIKQKGLNPRRLTPRECARLMGFPEKFIIPVSDTQAYRQFGNSIVVSIVEKIAKKLVKDLR